MPTSPEGVAPRRPFGGVCALTLGTGTPHWERSVGWDWGVQAPEPCVSRPALAGRIAGRLATRSVLIAAEAGYGKTEALRQAAEKIGRGVAWIDCRTLDRGLRELQNRIDAVPRGRPCVVDHLDALMSGRGEELPLAAVLENACGRRRVAVAGRRLPMLRTTGLRAAGAIDELGPQDLAFTADECVMFIHAATGREATAGEIESIAVATEGWPLGVALATRLGTGEPFMRELSRFFRDEVLDGLE